MNLEHSNEDVEKWEGERQALDLERRQAEQEDQARLGQRELEEEQQNEADMALYGDPRSGQV